MCKCIHARRSALGKRMLRGRWGQLAARTDVPVGRAWAVAGEGHAVAAAKRRSERIGAGALRTKRPRRFAADIVDAVSLAAGGRHVFATGGGGQWAAVRRLAVSTLASDLSAGLAHAHRAVRGVDRPFRAGAPGTAGTRSVPGLAGVVSRTAKPAESGDHQDTSEHETSHRHHSMSKQINGTPRRAGRTCAGNR